MRTEQGKADLQELYNYLDGVNGGTVRLAWYGQNRAEGLTHREAIIDTINHFGLKHCDWFIARNLPDLEEA